MDTSCSSTRQVATCKKGLILSQVLCRNDFQLRGDLLQRRREAYLFAEPDRNRIQMNVDARGIASLPGPSLLRTVVSSRQSLSGAPGFVHHPVIQPHEKCASIRDAH